jgi:hypothetical protein
LEKSRKNVLEEIERWSKEIKRGAASLAIVAVLDATPAALGEEEAAGK